MTDLIKQFMENLNVPKQIFSTASSNVYALVAEKNGAQLGVSLQVLQKVDGSGQPKLVMVLRFIETKVADHKEPEFTGFKTRGTETYKDDEGKGVSVFMGEKHVIDFANRVVNGKEFHKMLDENNVIEQVREFIKSRVGLAGGKVTVSDPTFDQILQSKMEHIPTNDETQFLFKLPIIKGFNDQPESSGEPDSPEDE